jgi:hypothetical protein
LCVDDGNGAGRGCLTRSVDHAKTEKFLEREREREREREKEREKERERKREREREREITDPGKTRNFASRIYRSAAAAGQRN